MRPSYPIANRSAVVYIGGVLAFARDSRGPVCTSGAVLLTVLALAVTSFGCGSGDDESSTAPPASPVPQSSGDKPQAAVPEASQDSSRAPGAHRRSHSGSQESKLSHPGDREPAGAAEPTSPGPDVTAAEVDARCPATLTHAQCKAVIRATSKDTPSSALNEPGDCLKIMDRAECEALAAQLQAAFEKSNSFGFQECLRTQTPKCEEVFGPVLEQQYAASGE